MYQSFIIENCQKSVRHDCRWIYESPTFRCCLVTKVVVCLSFYQEMWLSSSALFVKNTSASIISYCDVSAITQWCVKQSKVSVVSAEIMLNPTSIEIEIFKDRIKPSKGSCFYSIYIHDQTSIRILIVSSSAFMHFYCHRLFCRSFDLRKSYWVWFCQMLIDYSTCWIINVLCEQFLKCEIDVAT